MSRKTVYKHTDSPYFVSDSFPVASWFSTFGPAAFSEPNHLIEVDAEWVTHEVTPRVGGGVREETSPRFKVEPVYIYGKVSENKLTDGTVYSNWFYPVSFSETFNPTAVENAKKLGANAFVKPYLNFWYPTHVFQNWKKLL